MKLKTLITYSAVTILALLFTAISASAETTYELYNTNPKTLISGTKTKLSGNTFTITPAGVETGHTIVLSIYKSGRLVDLFTASYDGEETLTYTTTANYDEASVYVLDSFGSLEPQHTKEKVVYVPEISGDVTIWQDSVEVL